MTISRSPPSSCEFFFKVHRPFLCSSPPHRGLHDKENKLAKKRSHPSLGSLVGDGVAYVRDLVDSAGRLSGVDATTADCTAGNTPTAPPEEVRCDSPTVVTVDDGDEGGTSPTTAVSFPVFIPSAVTATGGVAGRGEDHVVTAAAKVKAGQPHRCSP